MENRWPTVRYKHGRMKQKLVMTSACFRRLDVVAHRWGGARALWSLCASTRTLSRRCHNEPMTKD